jgi:hypothetical protein
VNGITFDAGGLIALERNDRRVFSILDTALADGDRIIVPATALAQVIRNPAKQVRLWRMIQFDKTEVVPLDGTHAQAVGALLAQTGTRFGCHTVGKSCNSRTDNKTQAERWKRNEKLCQAAFHESGHCRPVAGTLLRGRL